MSSGTGDGGGVRRARPARLLSRTLPAGVPGVRRLVRRGLGQAFGPAPFDPSADPGDPGLLGPGSVSWRVVGEPAAIVGGVRALLAQLTHPLAMAGVADHSDFRNDPLGRLQRTSGYVTALTFGSTREALTVTRAVRRAHATVRGHAPDGRPYAADDPHLLAWVSLALTSSLLATHRAYAPERLSRRDADRFVSEQSRGTALLDPRVDLGAIEHDADALLALRDGRLTLPMLEDGVLPSSVEGLTDALARYRDELGVDVQGRRALRFLLWPQVPGPLRAGYLPVLAGAVATLPRDLRELLGVPGGSLPAAAVRANTRLLLLGLRAVTGPSPSLALARRRAAAG